MNRIALTLLSVVVALPAAAQARPPQATDGIVAIVGTHPILWTEVLEVIGQERSRGAQLPQDSAGAADFAKNILNNLIDEQILLQRATGDTSITVADADLAQTVERQVGQIRSQFPSDQEFLRQLRSAGFGTQEEYRRWMTEQARKSEMQRRLVQKYQSEGKMVRVAVSDVDVNEAYEREKAKFPKRPPAVTFRQLVIAPQASQQALDRARAKAESLLAEIRRGADFEQVARRESQDSASKELGGDLGWNRRGELVQEFEQMMFALAPGQVSPLVLTPYGFHIIKVERAKPAEVKARHILIKPEFTPEDTAKARARADSALQQWRAGVPYDTLSKRYHDRDEFEGSLEPFPREQLPESYRTAIGTKVKGEFVGPFSIPDANRVVKFVVLQLTDVIEAGDYTVEEVRDRMRQQLSQERSFRRLLDQLKRETYVRTYPVEPFLSRGP
ncbi:MAG TPA: peptidylprolyl isomerase [Gemmatimonadaceae bacterium]|nr:peptidylprolyl isomerase [Gemmatimonadaceae bacterium]